jgi:hypothetical protein
MVYGGFTCRKNLFEKLRGIAMPALPRLASSILLAALATSVAAQAPARGDVERPYFKTTFSTAAQAPARGDADPLDALKGIARAKFEAARRTPTERAQALAETAQMGWRARLQEFWAGKITPDLLFEWSPLVLEAQLALLDNGADPAPLYEKRWRDACEVENIAKVKHRANKIQASDLAESRWGRLEAELDWLRHKGAGGKKAPSGPDLFAEFATQDVPRDKVEARLPAFFHRPSADVPRDKAEAVGADPRRLARERLTTARDTLQARKEEFQAGKIMPDLLLQSTKRVFDSELALLDKGADPAPLLEWRWKTLWRIERIAEVKIEAGKIATSDVAQCRGVRLDAEIAWVRAIKKKEKPGGRKRIASEEDGADDAGWARVKEEASRADVVGLLRDRLQTAREEYRGRHQEFDAGEITPDLALEASLHLLEAERAGAAGPKEEAAAVERYWRFGLVLEALAELKLSEGKFGLADFFAIRYARLQAESRMATALPVGR